LSCEVVGGDEGLAVEVAAALGEDLVFDVEPGCAGAVVFPDGARGHLALAEAGVGIGDDGEAVLLGCDLADDDVREVVECEEADVGDSGAGGDGGSGDVACHGSRHRRRRGRRGR
jgi:hypothetical protein